MLYQDYLKCAEKHLKGCASMLLDYKIPSKNENEVWLELYYLAGYIIEGITVYSAYKLYNWPSSRDVKNGWDKNFTDRTGLDFYRKRRDFKNNVSEMFPFHTLSVEGHRFQDIVKHLLKSNPSFNGIPYIGDGDIDDDVKTLIDNWKPDVRYMTPNNSGNLLLTQDVVARLMNTCYTIFLNHV